MCKGKHLSVGVVILVAVFMVVGFAGTALAAQPAQVGDPVATARPALAEVQQVQVTGANSSVGTLNAAVAAADLTIPVNHGTTVGLPATPFTIQIDSEQMQVTAIAGASNPRTWTVTRAQNGTAAASHINGSTVLALGRFANNSAGNAYKLTVAPSDVACSGTLCTTGNLNIGSNAAAVQAALNAAFVAAGSADTVTVAGGPASATGLTPFVVTWTNPVNENIDLISASVQTGAGVQVRIKSITQGEAPAAGGDVSPHGGYSLTTDYCLQCHRQHGSNSDSSYNTGEYALMRAESVVATCNTCHSLFAGTGGNNAYDPGIAGGTIGTASQRAAYENGTPANHASLDASNCPVGVVNCTYPIVPMAETPGVYGHKIGYGTTAAAGYGSTTASRYTTGYDLTVWNALGATAMPPNSTTRSGPGTASATSGGFYCGSCHTPHGADFGYAVNTEKGHPAATGWANGNAIWWENFAGAPVAGVAAGAWGQVQLFSDGTSPYGWVVCTLGSLSNADASCVDATTQNQKGETVSLYAYQLLTAGPNHQYTGGATVTNQNLCSNGLPGSVTPTTNADCTAIYGGGVIANYKATLPLGPQSVKIEQYNQDGAQWCGTCHSYALDTTLGGAVHAHPTGCYACHGNEVGAPASEWDFPHTTTEEAMLKELPDGLCITCHLRALEHRKKSDGRA